MSEYIVKQRNLSSVAFEKDRRVFRGRLTATSSQREHLAQVSDGPDMALLL